MAKRTMKFDRDINEYVYFLDGNPVPKKEWDEDWYIKAPDYSKGECPKVRGDLDDFSSENGGKGRWNPQVNGYCRNVQEVIDKGRAKGFKKIG